jgi:hypothetical protein
LKAKNPHNQYARVSCPIPSSSSAGVDYSKLKGNEVYIKPIYFLLPKPEEICFFEQEYEKMLYR